MLITCLPRMKVVSSIPVYVCLDLDLARRPNLTLLGLQASFWLNAYLGMRFSVNNKRWAIMVLINLPIYLTRRSCITKLYMKLYHEAALSRGCLITTNNPFQEKDIRTVTRLIWQFILIALIAATDQLITNSPLRVQRAGPYLTYAYKESRAR